MGDDVRAAGSGGLLRLDRAGAQAGGPSGASQPAIGGVATILVAANPEPAGSGSLPHTVSAATAFIAVAIWPAVSVRRGPSVPSGLRPAACVSATVIMLGLLVWFYVELGMGGRHLGLTERVLAGVEAIWPLAVTLTCYLSQSRAGTRPPHPARAELPEAERLSRDSGPSGRAPRLVT